MRGVKTPLRVLRTNRTKPLTIRDLSARTGFSIGHLSDVEQGKKEASPRMVAGLARVFGKSILGMGVICAKTFAEARDARA